MARRFAIRSGPHSFALGPGLYRIGRAPDCEIRLDGPTVSRHHAALRVGEEEVVLEERRARNGVRVNGALRRGATDLCPGDRVTVGGIDLLVVEVDPFPDQSATRPIARPAPRAEDAPEAADALEVLSGRERTVLEGIARGQTQREIALAIGVSVKTVETYRARLADKLGVATRAEMVGLALEAGLLGRP